MSHLINTHRIGGVCVALGECVTSGECGSLSGGVHVAFEEYLSHWGSTHDTGEHASHLSSAHHIGGVHVTMEYV
jgi:hypothetical protein